MDCGRVGVLCKRGALRRERGLLELTWDKYLSVPSACHREGGCGQCVNRAREKIAMSTDWYIAIRSCENIV